MPASSAIVSERCSSNAASWYCPRALRVNARSLVRFNAWSTLARIQLRAAAVFFEDENKKRGRSTNTQALNVQDSLTGFEMPRDIVDALAPYMRLL